MSKQRRARQATATTGKASGGSPAGASASASRTSAAKGGTADSGHVVRWDRALLLLLVALPVLFHVLTLLPELVLRVPSDNDNALHYLMAKGASDAIAGGRNPLDFWASELDLGFPQFLYYQNLPHLVLAAVHRVFGGRVDLLLIFNASRYVLMAGFPITAYWALRRMQFSMPAAAIAASTVSLVAGQAGYGLEYNSYTWAGRGLYTQLCAVHLTFVAMACLYRLLQSGRGYVPALLSLTALALTNFVYAYMMAFVGVILLLATSERGALRLNAARLAVAGVCAVAIASYMLVPFALDSSRYLAIPPGIKSADFDALTPIRSVLTGDLMDTGRAPVLTILTLLGAIASTMAIATRRSRTALFALGGFVVWLVLYQVRPTGVNLLGRVFHYDGNLIFRFVGVLEIFAVMLIGLGGEWMWNGLARLPLSFRFGRASGGGARRVALGPLVAFVMLVFALVPVINERGAYYARNREYMLASNREVVADRDLSAILDSVVAHPGGRSYIGNRHNWGANLAVGPVLKGYDLLRFRGVDAVTLPFQGLSLNTVMVWDFKDNDPAKYDLLDVRYAIGPAKAPAPPFFTPFVRAERYTLYRVPTSGIATFGTITTRTAIASRVDLSDAILAWSHGPAPAARQFIRWDYMSPAGVLAAPPACPDTGHIRSEKTSPGVIHLEVACSAAATVVLKVTYHPNWHVRVDGTATPTYMVSPSYIAFDVPAGMHRIDAVYAMSNSRWALLAMGLSVLVLAVAFRRQLDWLPMRLGGATARSATGG